jgi:hypothetical protein
MAEPGKSPRSKYTDPTPARALAGPPASSSPLPAAPVASVRSDPSRRTERQEATAQLRQETGGEEPGWLSEFGSILSLTDDGGARFLKLAHQLTGLQQPSPREALSELLGADATAGQQKTLQAYLETISPQDFEKARKCFARNGADIQPEFMQVFGDVEAQRAQKTSRQQIRETEAQTHAVLQELGRKDPALAARVDARLNAPDDLLKKKRTEKKD